MALLPRRGPVTTQNTRIALPVTPQELKLCWSHSGWYGTFEVRLSHMNSFLEIGFYLDGPEMSI